MSDIPGAPERPREPADERSVEPGRRKKDHHREVQWKDYRKLLLALWFLVGVTIASWVVIALLISKLFGQLNDSRAYTARSLCAAVDGVRAGTRDGFHTVGSVAKSAGLPKQGVVELHGIVVRLNHPPAAQDCRVIVRAVKNVQTGPNQRKDARPSRSP